MIRIILNIFKNIINIKKKLLNERSRGIALEDHTNINPLN